jgi:enamine deaminase RidA (YjgF/YER057c/UK114 family)
MSSANQNATIAATATPKPITIQPDGWAPALGYANGTLMADGTLHVGGQIGWNAQKEFVAHDFLGQFEQCLRNIADIVTAAGGEISDIGRLTWYIKGKSAYLAQQREVGQAYRRVFGRHYPAMAVLVVQDLIEDAALVEIEATAYIQPTETA